MFQEHSSDRPTAIALPVSEPTRDNDYQPIRHILIGQPPLVERTKKHLQALGYAEVIRWTNTLQIPGDRIILTPDPGHAMSLLVKLVRLE
ncbi:MAG: hypothetical protein F6K04_19205 [Leptolyngbya sp. SIO4C5]|uniref:hypothetical protein n=1 Tax=Sphaerothrix gracilis TaxID=3151835 RepID=UPI0013C133F5|nr:hypothetical protein [Leptolyngbya sp. SIO4C5]